MLRVLPLPWSINSSTWCFLFKYRRDTHRIILKSTKAKNTKSLNSSSSKVKQHGKRDIDKYEQYFDFQSDVKYLKPHQILAINRADDLKILTIKIVLPDSFKTAIQQYVYNVFMTTGITYDLRTAVFQRSFDECFVKKCKWARWLFVSLFFLK